jgi:putative phage-type endonuclease
MTDRAEWLEWRRGGIGGSDIAAIMGLSPWTSPYSLWIDKTRATADDADNDSMEFGRRAEPMLAGYFEDRTGLVVAGEQTWCSKPGDEWMRCTVDGFVFDGGGEHSMDDALGVAEYKTTGDAPAEWEREIPPYYQCQGQWTLAVTGLERVWFGVLHLAFGRPKFRVYELVRDEADIALLTKAARAFWFDHVVTGIAPATDGSEATTEALRDAWEPNDEATVEADLTVWTMLADLATFKARAKAIADDIAAHENAIKAHMAEATALTHGVDDKGRPVVLATWREQTADRIDAAALRAELPDVAAKFTKSTQSRVFRLKPTKGT